MHATPQAAHDILELVTLERHAFAAKVRMARAVLGWSQSELGLRVGLTQRAIHKLEHGETEPRRTTVHAIVQLWNDQSIAFEDLPDGGFRATVRAQVLDRPVTAPDRRRRAAAAVAAAAHRPQTYRA